MHRQNISTTNSQTNNIREEIENNHNKLRFHESRIEAHDRGFEKINGMFSNFNLEWTGICEAIINNKDSIEELIAEVNSLIKFKEEAEAEAARRKDEYNLLSNRLDTLESYLSKIKTCGCPEKPTGVNVVYQETVNLQDIQFMDTVKPGKMIMHYPKDT